MFRPLVVLFALTVLSGCVSGLPQKETYVAKDGTVMVIENDRESCGRACDNTYARCMDSTAVDRNSGIIGPTGLYGASGECRSDLARCKKECKSQ